MHREPGGKSLVRGVLGLVPVPRPPLIPVIYTYAAKLEQTSPEHLFADPTALSNALAGAQELLNSDAIVIPFDSTLEAEALGATLDWGTGQGPPRVVTHPWREDQDSHVPEDLPAKGRIPVALEAIRRLKVVMGERAALASFVTGPLLLSQLMSGRKSGVPHRLLQAASRASLLVSRAFCEERVDLLAVVESWAGLASAPEKLATRLASIWNVASYFRVTPMLAITFSSPPEPAADPLGAMGIAYLGPSDLARLLEIVPREPLCFGLPVPGEGWTGDPESAWRTLRKRLEAWQRKPYFLTTPGEVPWDAPAEKVRDLFILSKGGP